MTQGVQTSYDLSMGKGYPGQLADMQDRIITSSHAEGAIGFGLAVEQGTAEDEVKRGVGGAALGVSVRSVDRENNASDVNQYSDEETAAVLERGFIYASIDGTGVKGAALTYITTSGQLSTAAADGTHIALNAKLEEAVAITGDIAKVWVYIK